MLLQKHFWSIDVNFDSFLTRLAVLESEEKHIEVMNALMSRAVTQPNMMKKSVQIEDFVQNLKWAKEPHIFLEYLSLHRSGLEQGKDFHNRRILSFLGEYVDDYDFWTVICMQYPEYAKFYSKATGDFKTLMKLVT